MMALSKSKSWLGDPTGCRWQVVPDVLSVVALWRLLLDIRLGRAPNLPRLVLSNSLFLPVYFPPGNRENLTLTDLMTTSPSSNKSSIFRFT